MGLRIGAIAWISIRIFAEGTTMRFIFLATMALIACAASAKAGSLDEDAFKNIPLGKVTKFSNLSSFDTQAVCLLQPYQGRLSSKDALAARVNKYLAAKNYVPDEGHFAFVLIGKEAIEITTFNRSQKLDVLAKDEVSSPIAEMLPKGFAATDCASGQSAAFVKIEFRARTYVLLGQAR
ncbi:hypothetical protein [Rhizobium leguminosarum]|uniref:hypothetical protein n=1 Tax=Rhizobium leguminosarum TaxID=384 RepID=UPI0021BBCE27|nr:hypothetical protein [Rhizobium leguminosarum]